MSRLTKWENEHAVLFDYDYEEMNDKFYADNDVVDCVNLEFVLEKLAEYEDLEDKGLLLKLPCKVGDIVYNIVPRVSEESTYREDKVTRIEIYYDSVWMCFHNGLAKNITQIGKSVFLTKEEAEQKLKEMESDTNGKN